jgi:hypothetical protein
MAHSFQMLYYSTLNLLLLENNPIYVILLALKNGSHRFLCHIASYYGHCCHSFSFALGCNMTKVGKGPKKKVLTVMDWVSGWGWREEQG